MDTEKKITLYTTHCPMCKQLERQLSLKGLEYTQVEGAEAIKELGFTVAPILEVDGQYMNFREAIGWVRSQKEPA